MEGKSETTLTVTLGLREAGVISSALKYASKMQRQYESSPNCFERVHAEWNGLLEHAANLVRARVNPPEPEGASN